MENGDIIIFELVAIIFTLCTIYKVFSCSQPNNQIEPYEDSDGDPDEE